MNGNNNFCFFFLFQANNFGKTIESSHFSNSDGLCWEISQVQSNYEGFDHRIKTKLIGSTDKKHVSLKQSYHLPGI